MDPRRLLAWYDDHGRDLPWRRNRDPYRVWISEVMLQQTQVRTVLPYYRRFLERFPTVDELAAASLEEVLALWSGLGYYRRARQLHRAACQVVEAGRGFPKTSEELRELPGVGPYTAAAVASIAFDERVPVLDGNVERLLCRWLGLEADPKKAAARRRLLDAAREMLDPERPGDGNQALMEIGATVCRPTHPDCARCPLGTDCQARREGDPGRYPPPRRRRAVERHHLAVAVVRDRGRVLLFRRSRDSEVLPGMWELPTVPQKVRGTSPAALSAAFSRRYGGLWDLVATSSTVRHGITYRSLVLHVYEARLEEGGQDVKAAEGPDRDRPEAAWVGTTDRDRFPASSMVEKVLSALGQ